jgi:hypothetical protein
MRQFGSLILLCRFASRIHLFAPRISDFNDLYGNFDTRLFQIAAPLPSEQWTNWTALTSQPIRHLLGCPSCVLQMNPVSAPTPAAPPSRIGETCRAYLYLGLVPACSAFAWTILIANLKRHPSESAVYTALDVSLYVSAIPAALLIAIPIFFRRLPNLVGLWMVAAFCGFMLAWVTFWGYMTLGFGMGP